MDLVAILLVTLFLIASRYRGFIFLASVCDQITGLLATRFTSVSSMGSRWRPASAWIWARACSSYLYGLDEGDFPASHGELRVASASALVSELGNLGSILTTYARYTRRPEDAQKGLHQYQKRNLVMVRIFCLSILKSSLMAVLLKVVGNSELRDY